jgi:4-nitrophenyl phosphatase
MNQKTNLISNFILDMDGVLWHGETPVPGLASFFDEIDRRQIGYILATNNATKTQQQYAEKFKRFGVEVPVERILTSSEATAGYLREAHPLWRSAYVIGEIGLQKAMTDKGFEILDDNIEELASLRADVVVVGMTRHFCYRHLATANLLINQGAAFVGTNPDVTFPHELGKMPGAGSILAFLETSSGVTPEVIGKPNGIMFREAIRRLRAAIASTVMVGDRLNTDIAGAQAIGLRTILLLSGISTKEDLGEAVIQPDWVFDDLKSLTSALGDSVPLADTV